MKVSIKRENWKGKYWVVARIDGKISSRVKYSKSVSLKSLKSLFKKNRSLDKDIIKTKLSNVTEVVDLRKNVRLNKKYKRFQAVTEGRGRNTGLIIARSQQYDIGEVSKDEAIQESQESFLERLSQRMGGDYDAEEGANLVAKNRVRFRSGIVYYV